MGLAEDSGRRIPAIGQASAEDRRMLSAVFSTLLERAASNGGSLLRRDADRVRTEFPPDEDSRFARYSDAHDSMISALCSGGASGLPEGLFENLVELYAGDVIDDLYPGLAGDAEVVWRDILLKEIGIFLRNLVRIDARLGTAYRRVATGHGAAVCSEDLVADREVIATLRAANRQLADELREGAGFGRILSMAVNSKVRHTLGHEATRAMFIGVREAETIVENLVGARHGNRFRMAVVEPSRPDA